MKIAIIGAGNVGQALGFAWAKLGHEICFGVRDPESAQARALLQRQAGLSVASNGAAAACSELVALATPWDATRAAVASCGDLAGKIVMDCTNPIKADLSGLALGCDTSGAEQIASWAPGAQLFKAMNQIGFNLMDQPHFAAGQPVMFVCGEGAAKAAVLNLVATLGFEAVDAGGLAVARLLEPYAMLWIHLAITSKLGRDFAFSLLRPATPA
ncbi:MAG TPA: NAD(P)-binding domain-containing protein [Gammaproteobacteria bacterium]|nr:NAD(P)-binding domain-containing protein [Gammaproteobacteria bacterium]